LLYAYLEHPVEAEGRHDVQTAYGYGGPLLVGEWPADSRLEALQLIGAHLRERGAVAEFVRCHTEWVDGSALAAAGYEVFQVRTNVECGLGAANVAASWHSTARRNLRKARAAGLTWRVGTAEADWRAFESLYARTAERLAMAPPYRFDQLYFASLSRIERVRLILVESGGGPVAGAVVFLGGTLAHYHLGASDFAHQHVRPNDYLYFAMATCARAAECERIVWGGGLSNEPSDTLFRFKSHFGQVRRPAYVAGRLLDPPAFERLCRAWSERHPGRTSRLFLRYRA
jgi:hypothetical protein